MTPANAGTAEMLAKFKNYVSEHPVSSFVDFIQKNILHLGVEEYVDLSLLPFVVESEIVKQFISKLERYQRRLEVAGMAAGVALNFAGYYPLVIVSRILGLASFPSVLTSLARFFSLPTPEVSLNPYSHLSAFYCGIQQNGRRLVRKSLAKFS